MLVHFTPVKQGDLCASIITSVQILVQEWCNVATPNAAKITEKNPFCVLKRVSQDVMDFLKTDACQGFV